MFDANVGVMGEFMRSSQCCCRWLAKIQQIDQPFRMSANVLICQGDEIPANLGRHMENRFSGENPQK
jgi:hypothetical protein